MNSSGVFVGVIRPLEGESPFAFTEAHAESAPGKPVVFGPDPDARRVGSIEKAHLEPDGHLVLVYNSTVEGYVAIDVTEREITRARIVPRILVAE